MIPLNNFSKTAEKGSNMEQIKVVMVRIDGLTCTFDVQGNHMEAVRQTVEVLESLWAQASPVAKVFFAKPGRLEEIDVDLLKSLKGK